MHWETKFTVHKSHDWKKIEWTNQWNRTQTVFIFDLFELTITMGFIDTDRMKRETADEASKNSITE